MDRASRDDVAVFVDFENIYVSVREKFDVTPNFELIMDRCEDYGRIVIARAYADWYRYPRVTSALFANGVEPMYVPTYYYDRDMGRTGRPIKNSVDIHLCIDAMRSLYSQPNVVKYVLVTGDRDFIPLVNAIRQHGKDVIVIGIGGASSAHLAQSADEFLFYEQIVDLKTPAQPAQRPAEEPRARDEPRGRDEARTERPRAERPDRTKAERAPRPEPAAPTPEETRPEKRVEEPAPVAAAPAPERNPYDTLVDAIKLARQRGFVVNLGSLKVVMRELDSSFNENKYKDPAGKAFTKFKDFVKEAERQGKVQIFTNGTVTEIFLAGEDPYRMSVFAEELASDRVERELETELDQAAQQAEAGQQVEAAPQFEVAQPAGAEASPQVVAPPVEVPAAPVATEAPQPAPAAPAESATEQVRQTFADREWEVFRTSMSQFTEPVRFAEIFNALRGLRNQEVVELTNNELRELVKQAINRGMLQRTGRGARAYYRLSSQYRVAAALEAAPQETETDAASVAGAEAVAMHGTAAAETPLAVETVEVPAAVASEPPAVRRRRARSYTQSILATPIPGEVATETVPAEALEAAAVAVDADGGATSAPPAHDAEAAGAQAAAPAGAEAEAVPAEMVDALAPTSGASDVETGEAEADGQPAAPERPTRRRSRRGAAGRTSAEQPEAAPEAAAAPAPEQPAAERKTSGSRRRRKPAEPDAPAPAPEPPAEARENGKKRRRRKRPAQNGETNEA